MNDETRLLTITVTGAAGQIAYALIPRLGELLLDITKTKIILKLCDVEAALPKVNAVAMEIEDFACPWIEQVVCTSDLKTAFDGCQLALLIGAQPRTMGMERADLLKANGAIFAEQGRALNAYAAADVRVLVVANPCNTNAYICMNHARDIPSHHFYSLSMLDQNRAYAFVAQQYNLDVALIEHLCVWGNHSPTMVVDYQRALYDGKPLVELIKQHDWFSTSLQRLVAERGSAVIKARGLSSAASAANAIIDNAMILLDSHACYGSFSMGVCSHGEYGAQPGTIVSYPCAYDARGKLSIVSHLELDGQMQACVRASFDEISAEAAQCRTLGLLAD